MPILAMNGFSQAGAHCCRCAGISCCCLTRQRADRRYRPRRRPSRSSPEWRSAFCVRKGDTLVELSNPELEAGLVLAQAQLGQARAARDRVYAGPRQEQVDALARDIDMANANLAYAQQQFGRTSQLAATGFASHQDLDKATAAVETGNANLSRAKERYEAARLGPTSEERAIADAGVEVAAAAVAVVAARVAKLQIRAPSDGAVALLVAEPGEAIVPGAAADEIAGARRALGQL